MTDEGTDKDACHRKTGEHQSDNERRAAELDDIEWQNRREHGVLRVTEKLRGAEEQKCPGPEGVGSRWRHSVQTIRLRADRSRSRRGRQSGLQRNTKERRMRYSRWI